VAEDVLEAARWIVDREEKAQARYPGG
jgi:hypothetical protein